MKESIFKVSFAIIILSLSIICNAQRSSVIDKEFSLYSLKKQILPLNQLLDSAAMHSPLLKMIDSDIYIHELKMKSQKKDWLSYFSISGSSKYGMFETTSESEDYAGAYVENSTSEAMRYSIGISLKIPLNAIVDRSKVKLGKAELERIRLRKESSIRELRQLVIVQYNNVLKAHKRLVIFISKYESMKTQMIDIEINYKNGKLSLVDYTNTKNSLLDSELAYEEMKIELSTSINLLQETVGVRFNLN